MTESSSQLTSASTADNDYRKHIWDALRAGQEQYDKSLLTLSSGGLAISIVMLKDVFGKNQLDTPSMLVFSWILFCLCILATIVSFLVSQKHLRRHLEKYERSVASGNYDEMSVPDPLEKLTNLLNKLAGVCFFIAVTATIAFASINLKKGAFMTKELEDMKKGYTAPTIPIQRRIDEGYVHPPAPTPAPQQQPPVKK